MFLYSFEDVINFRIGCEVVNIELNIVVSIFVVVV